jgi:inosine-uridine nucleoside N-ribohydrolase
MTDAGAVPTLRGRAPRVTIDGWGRGRMDLIWDMETGDPDDFITLLFLLGHPRVNLIGVTVTPGTPDQVGVVRRALDWFGRSVPVGAFNLAHPVRDTGEGRHGRRGACVSSWHYAAFGDMPASTDAVPGPQLLRDLCGTTTTLVTGAPLKNLGGALRLPGFQLGEVVVQGGFAGAGVVPADRQLEKFRGMVTCPSYNLNGDVRSALAVIATPAIGRKRFVSKNVCHGVVYDRALHAQVAAVRGRATSLDLIWRGMDEYLGERPPRRTAALPPDAPRRESADPRGKMLHDPLAACCAIDPAVAEWAEVDLYRERGAWGSRPAPGSGLFITVGYDRARFLATLLEC